MGLPKYSVVVPFYNNESTIKDAILSIVSQSYDRWEVVLVNDGSTDRSLDRVLEVDDPRISVYTQTNGGVSNARNNGIKYTRGEYIAFLDGDDLWHADHLATLDKLVTGWPDAALWCSSFREFYDEKEYGLLSAPLEGSGKVVALSNVDWLMAQSVSNFVFTGCVVVRRQVLLSLHPCFPEDECLGEDLSCWFKLSELGDVVRVNLETVFYRRGRSDSLTSTKPTSPIQFYSRLLQLSVKSTDRQLARACLRLYQKHLYDICWNRMADGDKVGAIRTLVRLNPLFLPRYWGSIVVAIIFSRRVLKIMKSGIRLVGANSRSIR